MKKTKKSSPRDHVLPDEINADTYEKLSDEEKSRYRPANPAYQKPPRFCLWLYGLATLCVGLYIAFMLSPDFSDFFNQYIAAAGRWILATLTAWLPFSLGEFAIIMMPFVLVGLLIYAFKYRCETWRSVLSLAITVFSLIATVFSVFTLNFAAGYRGHPLDEKLELTKSPVSAEELYQTAEYLKNIINQESQLIHYGENGFSTMPYNLDTMRKHLNTAYSHFCSQHDFISHSPGQVKPVLLSEGMSYMHITGIYTFFTGEANINVNFPDYTIPYTAAHEMAHQRGISKEDEANFIAYLVCISSDDPYVRYSGYLNMYEYVVQALAVSDQAKFSETYVKLEGDVRAELMAYSQFFESYRHSIASQVSGAVNDTFLQIQGTEGTQSYGMVVDLAVAYHKQTIANRS